MTTKTPPAKPEPEKEVRSLHMEVPLIDEIQRLADSTAGGLSWSAMVRLLVKEALALRAGPAKKNGGARGKR